MSGEKDAPNRPAGFTSVLHIPRRRATDYETVPPRCLLFGRSAPRAECSECSRTRPRINNPNQTAFDATVVMAICIPACSAAPPKTIISIAASNRYAAFLGDDNNRHARGPSDVVAGGGSREAEGPGGDVYAKTQRGFVDTHCFIIDKSACNDVFPERAMTRFAAGTGGYRQVLPRLRDRPWGTTGVHIVYYIRRLPGMPPDLLWRVHRAGVDHATTIRRSPFREKWRSGELPKSSTQMDIRPPPFRCHDQDEGAPSRFTP